MPSTITQWSVEDYHKLIDSGVFINRSVQLINNELIEMSPEKPFHRNTNHKLVKYLRSRLENLAEVYEAHPISLLNSEPEPDIAIVKPPDYLYDDRLPTAEDIYCLIEISDSTLAYDSTEKLALYAANNIVEYWIVDLKNQQILVHREPALKKYNQITILPASSTVSFLAFEKLTIKLF